MEDDLVAWGRTLRIETRGRVTGRVASAVVGFVERPDGSLVVAAGSPDAGWALNLLQDPACRVTVGDASWAAVATALERDAHVAAVRELILRYGTPAENLGAGPSFELRRVDARTSA
jgi:deazaflavin-dependent oxidoreductase (nitroreductase family)